MKKISSLLLVLGLVLVGCTTNNDEDSKYIKKADIYIAEKEIKGFTDEGVSGGNPIEELPKGFTEENSKVISIEIIDENGSHGNILNVGNRSYIFTGFIKDDMIGSHNSLLKDYGETGATAEFTLRVTILKISE